MECLPSALTARKPLAHQSLHLRQRMFRRLSAELVQPSQLPSAHGPQARACWLERRCRILLRVCVFHQFHVYFESLSARGNLPRAVIFGNFLCTLHGAAAFVGCRVLSRAAGLVERFDIEPFPDFSAK